VPRTPGVTSALGILQVDLRHDILAPVLGQVKQIDVAELVRKFEDLRAEAMQILEAEAIPADRRVVELSVDVRYYGQTPYMNLRLDKIPQSREDLNDLVAEYRRRYESEFGYVLPEDVATVEIVNARVAAIGMTDDVELATFDAAGDAAAAQKATRPVYFDEVGDFTDTPIYDRALLTLLYDPRIQPGMTAKQVRATLPRVIQDLGLATPDQRK